jgi:hypothetical protein
MQWIGLKICCGMTVKSMGMLGVSVRHVKAPTVTMETVTLFGKGRQDLTFFVYSVYEINSKIFFLSRSFIFGGSS